MTLPDKFIEYMIGGGLGACVLWVLLPEGCVDQVVSSFGRLESSVAFILFPVMYALGLLSDFAARMTLGWVLQIRFVKKYIGEVGRTEAGETVSLAKIGKECPQLLTMVEARSSRDRVARAIVFWVLVALLCSLAVSPLRESFHWIGLLLFWPFCLCLWVRCEMLTRKMQREAARVLQSDLQKPT